MSTEEVAMRLVELCKGTEWKKAVEPLHTSWKEAVKKAGGDADQVDADLKASLKKYDAGL